VAEEADRKDWLRAG